MEALDEKSEDHHRISVLNFVTIHPINDSHSPSQSRAASMAKPGSRRVLVLHSVSSVALKYML